MIDAVRLFALLAGLAVLGVLVFAVVKWPRRRTTSGEVARQLAMDRLEWRELALRERRLAVERAALRRGVVIDGVGEDERDDHEWVEHTERPRGPRKRT